MKGYMLRVRLNRDERAAIRALAKRLGTNVSEVVRQLIRRPAGLPVAYDELGQKGR